MRALCATLVLCAVALGQGNLSFSPSTTHAAGIPGAFGGWVQICDVNGDGRDDVIYKNSGSAAILLSNPGGTLRPQIPIPTFTPALHCVDLNLDGSPDLAGLFAVSSCTPPDLIAGLTSWPACGAGPTLPTWFSFTYTLPAPWCASQILNVTFDMPNQRLLFMDDTFDAVHVIDVAPAATPGGPPTLTFASTSSIPGANFLLRNGLVADLDGDAFDDLIVQRVFGFGVPPIGYADMVFLHGTATGFVPSTTFLPVTLGQFTEPFVTDVDQDGFDDFVTNSAPNGTTVWFNDGGLGTWTAVQLAPQTLGGLCFGDIDGDGDLDAVGSDIGGLVRFFVHDGNRGFAQDAFTVTVPSSGSIFGTPATVACGDLNADGLPDLVFGTGSSAIVRLNETQQPVPLMRPGTSDGVLLETALSPTAGAPFTGGPLNDVKTWAPGDLVSVRVTTPGPLLGGDLYLVAESFHTGCPPLPMSSTVWVSGGASTMWLSPCPCPTTSTPWTWSYPVGASPLSGNSLLVQAVVVSPGAQSMGYATSEAHEIQF